MRIIPSMHLYRFVVFPGLLLFSAISDDVSAQAQEFVGNELPSLLVFYKHAHQHPELSLQEEQTSQRLADELRQLGFIVTEKVGGYGIVAIFSNGEGPRILYRTDMDALPVTENTGLPYASVVTAESAGMQTGVMHACGHDMHMTVWLGTARAMMHLKDQWKGTLMMIAQPAEEIGEGAKMMLDAGLYSQFGIPDAAIGLHCNAEIPAGQIGIADGYTMATTEFADIRVFGTGGHGASPHQTIDPVVLASMVVLELQTIVSRNLDPLESAVITVGAINGGTKHNIIPDEVTLKLTIRSFTEETRMLIHRRIREITRGIAISAGLPEEKIPEVTFSEAFTPANYNHPDLVRKLHASAVKVIGEENTVTVKPKMIGEDFSHYGHTDDKVPSVLFWLGTVPADRVKSGDMPGLHSARYYPDPEKSITTGVNVTTQVLLDLFKE